MTFEMTRHGQSYLSSVLQVLYEDKGSKFACPLWSEEPLQRPLVSEVWIYIGDHTCAFSNALMSFSHHFPSSASDQDGRSLLGNYH